MSPPSGGPDSGGSGLKAAGVGQPRDGRADDLKRIGGLWPKGKKPRDFIRFRNFDRGTAWLADVVAWGDSHLEGGRRPATRDVCIKRAKVLIEGV